MYFEIFTEVNIIISLDVFRNVKEIFDPKVSTGHALQLNTCDRMIVLHPYNSIIPGRYERISFDKTIFLSKIFLKKNYTFGISIKVRV